MRRPRSIYSVPVYLPWQPSAMFAEELEGGEGGLAPFFPGGQNVRFTHPHYTGQSVCVRERGRRGCQAIHHTGHTQGPLYED